jgi:hypothetical protein
VNYKDKIVIFPLFNTCYPQNLARDLASFKTDYLRYTRDQDFREIDDWIRICYNGSSKKL